MIYSHEVEMMCPVAQGANHGPAPIPEEAKWVQAKEIKDISGDGRRIAGERAGRGTIKKDPGAGILYQYLRAG